MCKAVVTEPPRPPLTQAGIRIMSKNQGSFGGPYFVSKSGDCPRRAGGFGRFPSGGCDSRFSAPQRPVLGVKVACDTLQPLHVGEPAFCHPHPESNCWVLAASIHSLAAMTPMSIRCLGVLLPEELLGSPSPADNHTLCPARTRSMHYNPPQPTATHARHSADAANPCSAPTMKSP
jgi:hypothetical protein